MKEKAEKKVFFFYEKSRNKKATNIVIATMKRRSRIASRILGAGVEVDYEDNKDPEGYFESL